MFILVFLLSFISSNRHLRVYMSYFMVNISCWLHICTCAHLWDHIPLHTFVSRLVVDGVLVSKFAFVFAFAFIPTGPTFAC